MPRSLCYIPKGGALIEACTRTIQGRHLLRPDPDFNDVAVGVLGRALDYSKIRLFACAFASNHYHLLYWAENALQMARFQAYFNGNLAKEIRRLRDWGDKIWAQRYRPMVVENNLGAQWQRLRYVLAHGTKEGLVASPLDWPGIHAARALVEGRPLVGHWYNRTREWIARHRGESFEKYDFATRYEIELEPLPAFRDLSSKDYRQKVAELIEEVENQTSAERDSEPTLGVDAVRRRHPHERPDQVKKSPAPKLFFAITKEARSAMRQEFETFVSHYRSAAYLLLRTVARGGEKNPAKEFPVGCFPPAMPFVGVSLPPPRTPPTRRLEIVDPGERTTIIRHAIPTVHVPSRDPPAVN